MLSKSDWRFVIYVSIGIIVAAVSLSSDVNSEGLIRTSIQQKDYLGVGFLVIVFSIMRMVLWPLILIGYLISLVA